MSKRTLSESSTGSEGEFESLHGINGAPHFKIPRHDSSSATSPNYRPKPSTYYHQEFNVTENTRPAETLLSQGANHERRESQASTASSATSRSSMSETDDDYAEGQKLSTVRILFKTS